MNLKTGGTKTEEVIENLDCKELEELEQFWAERYEEEYLEDSELMTD